MNESLTVLSLEAENVRKLKAVRLSGLPATGVITIAGQNDQGKTTVLELILAAVDLRRVDWVEPIRTGQSLATDVVVLQDEHGGPVMQIERIWKENGKTELRLTDPEGVPLKSPQSLLNGIVGAGIGFDPMLFARKKPGEMVDELLRLLQLPEDPRELDLQRARLYDLRTVAGREVTRLKGLHDSRTAPTAGVPDEEVSVRNITLEIEAVHDAQVVYDRLRSTITLLGETVTRISGEIAKLERELELKRTELTVQAQALRDERSALAAAGPRPTTDALRGQLEQAEAVNRQVREKQEFLASAEAWLQKKHEVDGLTAKIEEVDGRKRLMLAAAPFPIPGLGFRQIGKEWHVTYQDHALADSATSARIKVGLAIAMAGNPRLRVVLLREAEFLDDANRQLVLDWARENKVQVWEERVGRHEGAFVIIDGEVEG